MNRDSNGCKPAEQNPSTIARRLLFPEPLSPLQGLGSFCRLTQGVALGYHLSGFQPFESSVVETLCASALKGAVVAGTESADRDFLIVNGALLTIPRMTEEKRKSFACASRTILRIAGAS